MERANDVTRSFLDFRFKILFNAHSMIRKFLQDKDHSVLPYIDKQKWFGDKHNGLAKHSDSLRLAKPH